MSIEIFDEIGLIEEDRRIYVRCVNGIGGFAVDIRRKQMGEIDIDVFVESIGIAFDAERDAGFQKGIDPKEIDHDRRAKGVSEINVPRVAVHV